MMRYRDQGLNDIEGMKRDYEIQWVRIELRLMLLLLLLDRLVCYLLLLVFQSITMFHFLLTSENKLVQSVLMVSHKWIKSLENDPLRKEQQFNIIKPPLSQNVTFFQTSVKIRQWSGCKKKETKRSSHHSSERIQDSWCLEWQSTTMQGMLHLHENKS